MPLRLPASTNWFLQSPVGAAPAKIFRRAAKERLLATQPTFDTFGADGKHQHHADGNRAIALTVYPVSLVTFFEKQTRSQ